MNGGLSEQCNKAIWFISSQVRGDSMRPPRELDVYFQELRMSCSLITDSLQGLQQERQVPPLPCIQPTCQGQKMCVLWIRHGHLGERAGLIVFWHVPMGLLRCECVKWGQVQNSIHGLGWLHVPYNRGCSRWIHSGVDLLKSVEFIRFIHWAQREQSYFMPVPTKEGLSYSPYLSFCPLPPSSEREGSIITTCQ